MSTQSSILDLQVLANLDANNDWANVIAFNVTKLENALSGLLALAGGQGLTYNGSLSTPVRRNMFRIFNNGPNQYPLADDPMHLTPVIIGEPTPSSPRYWFVNNQYTYSPVIFRMSDSVDNAITIPTGFHIIFCRGAPTPVLTIR